MSTPIYIALYTIPVSRLDGTGSYHWAIALPHPRLDGPLNIYQIAFDDGTGLWKTDHKTVNLDRTRRFMAVIALPPLRTSFEEVKGFLTKEPFSQDDTPLLKRHLEWTCAQWVVRCLQNIGKQNWFSTAPEGSLYDTDVFYQHIRMKGLTYETALSNHARSIVNELTTSVDNVTVLL